MESVGRRERQLELTSLCTRMRSNNGEVRVWLGDAWYVSESSRVTWDLVDFPYAVYTLCMTSATSGLHAESTHLSIDC